MSSTQHQLIEQCAIRLRGIVEALDNIHDSTQHRSPHRWSTDLDDVHSSAESLLALIKDQAPALDAQDLALRTIAEYPCPEQDNMTAANMRQVAADAITGALAFGAQASQPPAEDHWLRPFYDIGRAEGQRTQELAMLVRMLASSLKRHAPESNLVARATNYLAAKGLAGTPLRDAPASVEQAGGDERAAFEAAFAAMGRPVCRADYDQDAYGTPFDDGGWTGWQARAALARPSQAQAEQAEGAHAPDEVFAGVFAEWWEEEGQYCRAGGGDYERTFAFQAWRHLYPLLLQARAALAQPSPVRSSLLINGYQLRAALDFIAPDGTAEQLESEACIEWRQQDADFLEAGLYAFCAEYPEEGGVLLDEEPTTAQPSPLQSEQAEAERPEVVAYRTIGRHTKHQHPHYALNYYKQNAEDQAAHWRERGCEVSEDELMTVAQHERIVGALRAENAKLSEALDRWPLIRDSLKLRLADALARVAELEGKLTDWVHEGFRLNEALAVAKAQHSVPDDDMILQIFADNAEHSEQGDEHGYCIVREQHAQAIARKLLAAAPGNSAQHSVPEGLALIPVRETEAMHDAVMALLYKGVARTDTQKLLDAYIAAAPGKEVPQAWLDVQAERRRQVEAEGWTPEHDDQHSHGQMARAAACYALAGSSAPNDETAALLVSLAWPWDEQWWKPSTARRDLIKAGALVLAEIERLDRAGISQSPQPGATTASS
ncbi:TPA: hypothetical protein ACKPJS_006010 [Pseudomonas aeruginosa]|uniref:hypothetical protein n=1 Tax=Pseudomonas aeruginosa TaxID=287 RepID=UPI0021613248|nr:hypothetical protein [Pseudomonas aeruginosa]